MNRRDLLTVISGSVLAGCTAGPGGEETDFPSSSGETETTHVRPETRLQIYSDAKTEYEFLFRLVRHETEAIVYESNEVIAPDESVRLDDAFSPGTDYRLTISHEEREVFTLDIYSYEGYVLTIHSETEVEVTRHVEI